MKKYIQKNLEYIDIEFDYYYTEGYIVDMITNADLFDIHKTNHTEIIIPKNINEYIEKNIYQITNINNSKLPFNLDTKLALTIDYFIKLITNSEINEMREILELDKDMNIYINMCDKDNDTLLHFSIFANNYKITKLLLNYGANPNKCDNTGQTPLFRAIFNDNDKIINLMLEHNAMIDITDNEGNTVLHIAVLTRNYLIIKSLLEHGAKVNISNKDNLIPLDYAIIKTNDVITFDKNVIILFNKYSK